MYHKDKDAGRASIIYLVEPLEVYKICVTEMLEERSIRIADGDEMEQFYGMGATVSVTRTVTLNTILHVQK